MNPSQQSLSSCKSRSAALVALAVGLLALLALPAGASALPEPTLFETTGGTGESSKTAPASELYKVNPATGATTSVGNTGYAITGLAQDPTTGTLYAVSNNNSVTAPLTLLTLNPANGAATPIGSLTGNRIADISFNSQGQLFGWDETGDDLASIDKGTGAVTVIPSALGTYGSGNSFDREDNLWLFSEGEGEQGINNEGSYFTVNTSTGEGTFRGRLTPIDEHRSSISAAAFDCARTTVYATVNNYGEPPANLVTINLSNGLLTNKGLTVTAADGLEWYCPLAFEFTGAQATVAAGSKKALTLGLVRGPRIKGSATVNFATKDGTAKGNRDFVPTSGTASFANNAAEASFAVTVTPDPTAGKNRTFEVVLSSPSAGGTVGSPFVVTVKAGKPRVKVSGPKEAASGAVTFRLHSNQTPAKFRCKLDHGKFKACGKNGKKGKKLTLKNLASGKHTLKVQAVNGAGLKSKPVKKKFTV
jgi:Calx-beta domain-containing protein